MVVRSRTLGKMGCGWTIDDEGDGLAAGQGTNNQAEYLDVAKLVKLRNSVAHVDKVVRSSVDLYRFQEQLQIATACIRALCGANAS